MTSEDRTSAARAGTWSPRRHWNEFLASVAGDVSGFSWSGPRMDRAVASGAAVATAIVAAIALDLDYPVWSAMTAFTVVQVSAAATALKGLLRIVGTLVGALAGVFLIGFVADSHVELLLALFASMTWGLYRCYRSRWYYAWLLGTITVALVLLTTLADPEQGLQAASYRAAEIAVGTAAAWLVGRVLLPSETDARRDHALIEPKIAIPRVAALTALEGGAGIVCVVLLYDIFGLPGFSSAAVSITRIADPDPQLGRHRGFLRLLGCVVGAVAGLSAVGLSISTLPTMLLVTFCVCGVFGYFGAGSPGSAYAGMQAAFAFLLAFVEGGGPATSLDPAIDRLAGILLALAVYWAIDVIVAGPEGGDREGGDREGGGGPGRISRRGAASP